MGYKTVWADGQAEDVINKSRFIGYAKPITTEAEATAFIEEIRKKHWDASHNVPVYVIGENYNVQRYSDDGEPAGTAGVPVLSMLKNEGITNVVVVVTRYFGGVKLGKGGLVRAYTHGAKIALEAATVVTKEVYQEMALTMDYTTHGKVQNWLMNQEAYLLADTAYTDQVTLKVFVLPGDLDRFTADLTDLTHGKMDINPIEETLLTINQDKIMEL